MGILQSTLESQQTGQLREPRATLKRLINAAFALCMLGLYYFTFLHAEGLDFATFYAAAQMLRHGAAVELYNIPLQQQFQLRFSHGLALVFDHTPVTPLILFPTTFFNLQHGYLLWTAISMALLAVCAVLLNRCLKLGRDGCWLFLLSFAFLPVHFGLLQGQIDVILLLGYVMALVAMKSQREFLAGLVLAISLVKFHLVLPFVAIMVLRKRWSFALGFLAGAFAFAAVSIAICGWNASLSYPRLLLHLSSTPASGINPTAMANLRGLYAFAAHHEPPIIILIIFSFALIALTARKWRSLESGFSAAVVCTVLVSYHLYPHDLILLLIPLAVAVQNIGWVSLKGLIVAAVALPVLPWFTVQARCFAIMAVPLAAFGLLFGEPQLFVGIPRYLSRPLHLVRTSETDRP